MIRVLVSGYGVMTAGVLQHLARQADLEVMLLSRHQQHSPVLGVSLTRADQLIETPPDVILGCFESDQRSRDFWALPEICRVVGERRAGCIEMSTLSLRRALDWHTAVKEAGGIATECPVTGSREGALKGTLSAFVYQSAEDQRVDRVLAAFVRRRYSFTAAGNPTRFKLVYNAWGASLLYGLAAFVPALQNTLGLDFDTADDVIRNDGWMSLVCASKLDRMLTSQYNDPDFAVEHMVKDLDQAVDVLGESHDLLALVRQAFQEAMAAYGAGADYSAVTGTSSLTSAGAVRL